MNSPLNYKFLAITAALAAVCFSFALKTYSLDEHFIRLAAAEKLPYFAKAVADEPVATQAILLDYADNQELVLKSFIALKKYPYAEAVFLLYGQEAEFKQILLQFGDGVIPVINYFLQNTSSTLTVQETAANLWQALQGKLGETQPVLADIMPAQRGWYAVNVIHQEGYNFLGQFAVDKQQQAHWIQTDRAMKALSGFFTGGIRELEMKYRTEQEITNGDILWAGVDVIALASTVKLLKASQSVAAANKPLSLTQKVSIFSAKLIQNKTFQSALKYSVLATTLYIVVKHPSVINTLLNESAHFFDLQPQLVKFLGWFLLLLPLLWLAANLLIPLLWLLSRFGGYKPVRF